MCYTNFQVTNLPVSACPEPEVIHSRRVVRVSFTRSPHMQIYTGTRVSRDLTLIFLLSFLSIFSILSETLLFP